MLWSLPEEGLFDGDVVPVYIRSNINQVYVIGVPQSDKKSDKKSDRKSDRKIEVPLWQVTDPESKKQADKTAEKYEEYRHIYARVKLDGLPVRHEATNVGRQVYRLKEGEVIKVLYEGKGAAVSGLEGEWFRVLMQDGTVGWCFSYNLMLFNETEEKVAVVEEKKDEKLERVLKSTWYPHSYLAMITTGRIDLNEMSTDYGFVINTKTKIATLRLKNVASSFSYQEITRRESDLYQLTETPVQIRIMSDTQIQVHVSGDFGKQETYVFSTMTTPLRSIIEGEKDRRSFLYRTIVTQGPSFSSANYGLLQFLDNGSFVWTGYSLLSPTVIPAGIGSRGKVALDCFISNELALHYDGALTFRFDSDKKDIVFLYKLEEKGLRMEYVPSNLVRNSYISSQSQNPIILFFVK